MKTPEGWKLVPVEPTEKMVEARWARLGDDWSPQERWEAMLAAAPTPPELEVVVTTTEEGEVVLVSRQDDEGRIIDVIWEKPDSTPTATMSLEEFVAEFGLDPEMKAALDEARKKDMLEGATVTDITPAQEDEPYGYLYEDDYGSPLFDYVRSEWHAERNTEVKLYTRPDSGLRLAAEKVLKCLDKLFKHEHPPTEQFEKAIESLRKALENK